MWQLEAKYAKKVLRSSEGVWMKPALYGKDLNKNGVLDGYEQIGYLHMQDNPNEGVHR